MSADLCPGKCTSVQGNDQRRQLFNGEEDLASAWAWAGRPNVAERLVDAFFDPWSNWGFICNLLHHGIRLQAVSPAEKKLGQPLDG